MADIKRQLFDKLKAFRPDKDFVIGVISNAKHDEDRQTILDFLDSEQNATVEDIILLSLHLCNERKTRK